MTVEPGAVPHVTASGSSAAAAAQIIDRHHIDRQAPIVGIAPGAAYGHAKQWPPARMAGVAAALVAERNATIVLVGAGHDRDAARAIESWLRANAPAAADRVINLAGRTSLGALVGLMSNISVFLSNDSGAMHLAAAVGCPVVAIFGPTDERATHPRGHHHILTASVFCRPCMLRDCPIDHRCMTRISVADVSSAMHQALGDDRGVHE